MNSVVRNIVLVVRPVHLFNVYEYMNMHPDQQFDIYIELNSHAGEREVLKKFSKFLKRDGVNIIFGSFLTKFELLRLPLFYFKVLFGLKKGVKYDVLLTSVGIKARVLYKLADFEKIILMDEGTSSLKYFPVFISRNKLFNERTLPKFYVKMLYRLLNIHDLNRHKPIEVFTIFKELLSLPTNVQLNEYRFVKDMFRDCVIETGTALVLGANYKRYHFTTEGFAKLIQEKLNTLDIKRAIYKYHKLENNIPINIPGVEIMNTDLPIEFYFLLNNFLPEYIVCFNSSVRGIMQKINENVKIVNTGLAANATTFESV
jgi:hypothetical protein